MSNISTKLTFNTSGKKKIIDNVRNQKTVECKTICVCSVTSTVHVMIPILKVLSSLGTVQVVTQDRSLMLLSPNMESDFEVGEITVTVVEEVVILEDDVLESFNDYDYNIVITQDYLPVMKVDKYIMLNRRHHFRSQIESVEDRYIPIFSACDLRKFKKKEERELEALNVYVNEKLMPLPSMAVAEEYLSSLLMGVPAQPFKYNAKVVAFVLEALNGIDECTMSHLRQILLERGTPFDTTSEFTSTPSGR